MNSETVDLIATDPPFNKGKDFHATPDSLAAGASFQDRWSWDEDLEPDWIDQIKDDWPNVAEAVNSARNSYGDDMGAYLCFMGVRLIAMHRLLKPTGSIYLHCDPTASHYLKMLMDAIFGRENFRSEITWRRINPTGRGSKRFANNADNILYYAKSDEFVWNQQYLPHDPEYVARTYRYFDENGRRYRLGDLKGAGTTKGSSGKPWRGVDPSDTGSHWAVPNRVLPDYAKGLSSQKKLDILDEMGRIYWPPKGRVPSYKRYLDEMPGTPIDTLWNDIGSLQSQSKERTGYPTQKPLALYERIIKASSDKGDMVLDPFAGCATTCIAAENLDRQWVGIDIWKEAQDVIAERMETEGLKAPKYTRRNKKTLEQFLFTEEFTFTDELPERTDDEEVSVAYLEPKMEFEKLPWEKLSRQDMVLHLAEAQTYGDWVICAGCGRELEVEFMELDHIDPRAGGGSNDISNRILLCAPCNKRKRHRLTLVGLLDDNTDRGWMLDVTAAKGALSRARRRARDVMTERVPLRLSLD